MAKQLNAFTTTAGETYRKKEDSAGRTYYVKDGEGRVNRHAYSGASTSRSGTVTTDRNGNVAAGITEAGSIGEAAEALGLPLERGQTFTIQERNDASDSEASKMRDYNKYLGFRNARKLEDPNAEEMEILEEYGEFLDTIRKAEDESEEREIRREYLSGY